MYLPSLFPRVLSSLAMFPPTPPPPGVYVRTSDYARTPNRASKQTGEGGRSRAELLEVARSGGLRDSEGNIGIFIFIYFPIPFSFRSSVRPSVRPPASQLL